MKIGCFSDTHGFHRRIKIPPDLDFLLFAGDMTNFGDMPYLIDFDNWLGTLNLPCLGIAGNHDKSLEYLDGKSLFRNMIYLRNEITNFRGLNIFATPQAPQVADWSFGYTQTEGERFWLNAPGEIDILLSHGPSQGILSYGGRDLDRDYGCPSLLQYLQRVKPRLHVFGHIHESYGFRVTKDLTSVNCAFCNYPDLNDQRKLIVVEID